MPHHAGADAVMLSACVACKFVWEVIKERVDKETALVDDVGATFEQTFEHQLCYCSDRKQLVPLRPYPAGESFLEL